jgi:hypothetical protein
MKSIILHSHEVNTLSETGIVTVVRTVKPQPEYHPYMNKQSLHWNGCGGWSLDEMSKHCPFGQPGEVRWVRETWGIAYFSFELGGKQPNSANIGYKADGILFPLVKENTKKISLTSKPDVGYHSPDVWRSSTTMSQWASRFNVECVSVEVVKQLCADIWDWKIKYKKVG